MALSTRYAANDEERAGFAKLLSWGFATEEEMSRGWLARPGAENARLGFSCEELVAGLLEIPMGQWFGGRSVPTLGVAGVAVSPEARGQGHALELMRQTLVDARERGLALSTLYPAALDLYRRAGYELSGSYCRYEVRLADLPVTPTRLDVKPITQADIGDIEATYQRVARQRPGYLDRSPYIWARVRHPLGKAARGVMVVSKNGIEGYAYLRQKPLPDSTLHDLLLSDFIAGTPRAAAALVGYLARHRSTARAAFWHTGVADEILLQLRGGFRVVVDQYWMLRLVNVRSALSARGYPPISAQMNMRIEDDLLPENQGLYRFEAHAGRAALERSEGAPDVRLDARALGPLYSGFASASALAQAGLIEADGAVLATLDQLFSGSSPGLGDFF